MLSFYFLSRMSQVSVKEGYSALYQNNSRSSLPEVFFKKGVLRNFAKSTGKHLCQSLFFKTVLLYYIICNFVA